MIVGIVVAFIVVLILLAVICVCCRRRRQANLARERTRTELMKPDPSNQSFNTSIGFDNKLHQNGMNGRAEPAGSESPQSDRRLLAENKPKSALDRFGPSPSQRRRQYSRDDNYEDVEQGYGQRYDRPPRVQESRRRKDDYSDSEDSRRDDYDRRDGRYDGSRRDDRRHEPDRRDNHDGPGKISLSDLKSNPQFRRSFHENELDAVADRLRRQENDTPSTSESGIQRPPKLPPVPKSPPRSPSPQRRGEKIAGIFRARPSSIEAGRVEGESESSGGTPDGREKKTDTKHTLRPNRGVERPSRDEKRKDRRINQNDESEEERRQEQRERDQKDAERQRRRREQEEEEEEERRRRKEEKRRQEEEEEEEREEERRRRKEKKRQREEKKRREEEEEEKERRRRRREREEDEEEDEKVYEGRFKKSASGRRSKGKGPRMARSRSTGNALEEMDRNYQRSRSKSPSSVRSLNFHDDDDDGRSDADSSYLRE